RRPGWHVHRVGSHRGPPRRHGDLRHVPGHQPGRRHQPGTAEPRRSNRSRPGCRSPHFQIAGTDHREALSSAIFAYLEVSSVLEGKSVNHTQKIQLLDAAGKWAAQDPDPQTQEELQLLIQRVTEGDALAFQDISERFSGVLEFGTAGLRAELGAGPMRMNRVVVMRTAAGIARFLNEQANGQYTPKVVIGFDARFNSDVFAQDSA